MDKLFCSANICIPKTADLEKWAVIACDQYTSNKAYWDTVKTIVGYAPSTLNMILPEVELEDGNLDKIQTIHETMEDYLNHQFKEYEDAYVYVERTMTNGYTRCGVVGCIDLEHYNYHDKSDAKIRATEQTVLDRIPPRMAVRKGASIDMPHVLLLCDDEKRELIESLTKKKEALPLLYDFDLMQQGGHIKGYLVQGNDKEDFESLLEAYYQRQQEKYGMALDFLVGDGNHSLASAKECYEEYKKETGEMDTPIRYALVELNNIYAYPSDFEPIHRILKEIDVNHFLQAMQDFLSGDGVDIKWESINQSGKITINCDAVSHPLEIIQPFLDNYLEENGGKIDYIHGLDEVEHLLDESSIALIFDQIKIGDFFHTVFHHGSYPRKTFSIGEADEKRFYLECRSLK